MGLDESPQMLLGLPPMNRQACPPRTPQRNPSSDEALLWPRMFELFSCLSVQKACSVTVFHSKNLVCVPGAVGYTSALAPYPPEYRIFIFFLFISDEIQNKQKQHPPPHLRKLLFPPSSCCALLAGGDAVLSIIPLLCSFITCLYWFCMFLNFI